MNKVLLGLVSGVALFGLAACGDTDDTTTEGIENAPAVEQAPAEGGTTTPPPVEPDTGGTGTAQ